ncbi:MAG: hypothetical protein NUV82_00445 [Candidatus Komeilibacteria bacterium]|nr:hypothetical protein [Candidatus Komeilibacteria bacterium]
MNKTVVGALFALVVITIPLSASALSWSSIFWWLNDDEPQLVTPAVEKKDVFSPAKAQTKYELWLNTYDTKDGSKLISNEQNLTWTEKEFSYLLEKGLGDMKNPPLKDPQVSLVEGRINLRGYLLEPLEGKVDLEVRPVVLDKEIYFYVTKANFKGFYFPHLLANKILEKYTRDTAEFLYTYPDYTDMEIIVESGKIQLDYK